MTVDRAVIEQTLYEFCATEDKETATDRISIWLSVAHREGGVKALHDAANDWWWSRIGKHWLNARADKLATGDRR